MNLEEMKKSGLNQIEILDSFHAPLLQLKIALNENTVIPNTDELEIYIDSEQSNEGARKTITYHLERPLAMLENKKDEFIIEPNYLGNKIHMTAKVSRNTKESEYQKEIEVGDNLSGKTLILNFPEVLGTNGNYYQLFSSEKYRIREQYGNGINRVELQSIETTEVIGILYEDEKENITSFTLPKDFGVVTSVIDKDNSFSEPLNYIKYQATQILASELTEEIIDYIPITLREGKNYISTNYQNANIEIIYPKQNDFIKYFINTSYAFNLNNEDKFLTLDDIYFKDCFTKLDENIINALLNKLTIKCMNSTNNTFSLDCDGNLVVNSITTKVKNPDENALTFDKIYPVGSIYTTVINTNPSTLFGGTWTRFAEGKTLFGVKSSETEFNTILKTGGSKALQSHTHTGTTGKQGNHQHEIYSGYGSGASMGQDALVFQQGTSGRGYNLGGTGAVPFTSSKGEHTHSFTTGSAGSGNAQNLPPYITVYFWRRTA